MAAHESGQQSPHRATIAAQGEAAQQEDQVKEQRTRHQRPKEAIGAPSRSVRGQLPAGKAGAKVKQKGGQGDHHTGNQIDVRVADRIDILAEFAGSMDPVRISRQHLQNTLHRADEQSQRRNNAEFGQIPIWLYPDMPANPGG